MLLAQNATATACTTGHFTMNFTNSLVPCSRALTSLDTWCSTTMQARNTVIHPNSGYDVLVVVALVVVRVGVAAAVLGASSSEAWHR